MPVDALMLDFGEVLTRSQPRAALERMATLVRLPFDELVSRYWRHRPDYDGGITGEEYWLRVLDRSGSVSAEVIADLIDADFQSWSDYRPRCGTSRRRSAHAEVARPCSRTEWWRSSAD